MCKKIISVICGCLLSIGLFAQANEIDLVLRDVEQNNKELRAYQSFIESQRLEYKTSNNLPDPRALAFYLPFGTHTTSDYSEFQISQSFEFPSVYAARGKWIDRQGKQLQLEYSKLRERVLLSAKNYCLELIFLNRKIELEQLRVQQARQVFNQIQDLFEKDQVGVLELNKAKIAWMQNQFVVEQFENEKRNMLLSLQKLNGGQPVAFDQVVFIDALDISPSDSIWQQKTIKDPALKALEGNEAVSLQQIKLEKTKVLPNLTAGFNRQGVLGQNYSGIYGAITVPLWSSKNKVKAAEAQYQYQQSYTDAIATELYSNFQARYNQYELMLRKFREYQTTLEGLNSEDLLLEAYGLGEISFMEYYIELQFYRQARDKMLQLSKELNQLKAELLKHQL